MSLLNKKQLSPKIKVVVPKKVENQFKHLCKEIPHVEWSGPLFYTIEGSITKPNSLVITLQEILPLDKGSSGYTEYNIGLPVAKFMNKHNAIDNNWKIGHIHSHNSMSVFFSGTDTSELTSNSENHNFYLSVIVNNKSEILGKVGVMSQSTMEELDLEELGYVARDENGDEYVIEQVEKVTSKKFFEYDCEFFYEEEIEVSDEFKELITKMTSHRYGSREFPSSKPSKKWWDRDEEDTPGFLGKSQRNNYGSSTSDNTNHTSSTVGKSSLVDERIHELAFQLIADGDTDALTMSSIEDICDMWVALDWDPKELADSMDTRYEDIFNQVYQESEYTPKLYVLRSVIKMYNDVKQPANKSQVELLDAIVKKLQVRYEKLEKSSKLNA